MNENEKHTPTPWAIDATEYDGKLVVSAVDEDQPAAVVYPRLDDDPETARANAALIVRAVNNHAALVAALQHAENALDGRYPWSLMGTVRQRKFTQKEARETALKSVRAALAAARDEA